ncbi:PREDICTED: uncharacterized protein LOC105120299 [Populus euphratica]|uniref:S-protein homolog n=1 Tax=Populus euphratica TaxID=75702 RepID=A0AAJ6TTF0_POPEU|nr:PREDICTED: uncharacterized protein LOC105120299 [Populus euphratica]
MAMVYVYIFNDLNKDTLSLRCKSKHDDLGGHALPVEANFHFTFKVNFWGTTLFWCNFNWGKNHGGSYDIFWYEDDLLYKCSYKTKNCTWHARNDGIYSMGIPDNRFINFYYWKRRTVYFFFDGLSVNDDHQASSWLILHLE